LRRPSIAGLRALTFTLGALTGACRRETPSVVRLATTPARATIADESRYVLVAHPASVVRARDEITLPDLPELRVPADPTPEAGDVRLDAHLGIVRVGSVNPLDPRQWRTLTVSAAPVVRRAGDGVPGEFVFPLAPELRGGPAVLTVVAHPLPDAPVDQTETAPFDVPAGARLRFGFAVEEAGWTPGWPPVVFRVETAETRPVTLFERRLDPSADPRDRRWFDASVSLAPLAGRRVALRFVTEAVASAPGTTVDRTFAVFANPEVVAAPAATPRRSIVLVSIDALRARSVGAYGYFRPITPALDARLAAEGARVRNVVTAFPYTPPSHMTMLTGVEPCAHGVGGIEDRLAANVPTLAELLRAAGYSTAGFTEDALIAAASGFERGFDVYHENRSDESAAPGFAADTFAAARAWLATQSADRPFFLFVHTYQVHDPYRPPRGYLDFFPGADEAATLTAYEREVRYVDDVIAGFLDDLDARGLAAQTVVVVTSDHGDAFGEHLWGHGYDLHDEVLLVPLLVRAPGLVPRGRVVEEQVGLVDLAPTLLDLVGVPPAPAMQGRSFADLLTGRGGAFEERPVLSAALGDETSVRTRQFKYVKKSDVEQLYRLGADPGESNNLAATGDPWLEAGRDALERANEACIQWRLAHLAVATPATESARAEPKWLFRQEDVERKLRSLGYVQ
jgi:arylsulfatase A-like enzyme